MKSAIDSHFVFYCFVFYISLGGWSIDAIGQQNVFLSLNSPTDRKNGT
jgi:hypothetical protein